MTRESEQDWDLSRVDEGRSQPSLWRKVLTVTIAMAFTVVTISLGLIRHRHTLREEGGLSFRAAPSNFHIERSR